MNEPKKTLVIDIGEATTEEEIDRLQDHVLINTLCVAGSMPQPKSTPEIAMFVQTQKCVFDMLEARRARCPLDPSKIN